MKITLPIILITIGVLLMGNTPKTFADDCGQTKGGLSNCPDNSVTLLKTVLDPAKNIYVQNLGYSDNKYHSGDQITFHITIANKTKDTLSQVIIKDAFPEYVTFISGTGNFDIKTKTLSFLVFNLKPDTTQTFAVSGKIANVSDLPKGQTYTCLANKATATLDNNKTLQSLSQFCIEKVFPAATVTKTPSTGPEMVSLFGLISSGIAGLFIKKFSKKQ